MRKIIFFAIIAVLVVFARFVIVELRDIRQVPSVSQPADQVDTQQPVGDITTTAQSQKIVVKKEWKDSLHTITGVITLPTPCYDILSDVVVMESYPEQVRITLITEARDGVCVQVLDDREFVVQFQASEIAQISATLNGERVELVEL